MKIWAYPGSFDPVTLGHMDVIERASKMCDKLIVGVLENSVKTCVFPSDERVELLKLATENLKNVEIQKFSGLLIDFLHNNNVNVIIKGLRAITDFEYELQMSYVNKLLDPEVETIFLAANQEHTNISSSIVRELCKYGVDISQLVPEVAIDKIKNKFI